MSALHGLSELWHVMGMQMLYAGIIFVVTWLLSRAARSPALLYALWGLVVLRLILPVDLASPLSVSTLLNHSFAAYDVHGATETMITGSSAPAPPTPMAAPPVIPSMVPALGLGLWSIAAAFLARRLVRQRRTYGRLARRAPCLNDPVATCLLHRWRELYGIRRPVRLVSDDSTTGPFTIGTLRPIIFVPRSIARRPQLLEATLAHELAHVRRLDDLRLLFQDGVRVLWVGFPPVHIAVAHMRRQRERLCDRLATSQGKLSRNRYVAALKTMLREGYSPAEAVPALGFSRTRHQRMTRMRFESLLYPKSHARSGWLVYAAVLVLVMPMAPMALASPEPTPQGESPSPTPETVSAPSLINPLPGEKLTSGFGMRKNPFDGKKVLHGGVDIKARSSSRVLAPADGVVELATERWQDNEDWGTVVILDHGNGLKTRYAHLDSLAVKEGESVKQGQVIATPGNTGKSTGVHLHFEVWQNADRIDPATVVSDWQKD